MSQPNVEPTPSRLLVAATVIFYLVAALAMVMANKWVLIKTTTPLFFLLVQLLISVVLLLACQLFGFLRFPLRIESHIVKGLLPMILINVLGLSFNNYLLVYVDASFYQVARGLVLPLTVLFSYLVLASRPSFKVLFCCSVITAGFIVGILLDSSTLGLINPRGLLFGILSSCTTAMHAIVIKKSLAIVKGSAMELAWYSNVCSSAILAPMVILVGESKDVYDLIFGAAGAKGSDGFTPFGTFLWGSAITGIFGFLICIAGFLSIKITSPITHMVSSAVRGIFQSFLGVWLFGDIITTGRGSSIAIILAGSIYYTWVKNEEVERERAAARSGIPLENGDRQRANGGYERVPLEEVREVREVSQEKPR